MFGPTDKVTRMYVFQQVLLFLVRAALPYFVILFLNFIISYFHLL